MTKKDLEYFINYFNKDINELAQVGAHFGQEIEIFEKFDLNHVHLFEPIKDLKSILLEKTKNKKNYSIHSFALGNENIKKQMFYSGENYGQSSSILEPALHKKLQPKIKFEKMINIEVKKFIDLNIDNVNFLIMDVQGFELEVLKGFEHKLKNVGYIFTEVNRDYLYDNNVLIKDLDKYLTHFGFLRIWTTWRSADMPWGDAFYIRMEYISLYRKLLLFCKNIIFTSNLFFILYRIFDFRVHKKKLKKYLFKKS